MREAASMHSNIWAYGSHSHSDHTGFGEERDKNDGIILQSQNKRK